MCLLHIGRGAKQRDGFRIPAGVLEKKARAFQGRRQLVNLLLIHRLVPGEPQVAGVRLQPLAGLGLPGIVQGRLLRAKQPQVVAPVSRVRFALRRPVCL